MQQTITMFGLLMLLHAASAMQSVNPAEHAAANKQYINTRRLQVFAGPSYTHGFRLEYQFAFEINTTTATPDVAKLADHNVNPADILGLLDDFGSDLSTALTEKLTQLYPPGMKDAIVSQLQPGSPVRCKAVMYTDLQYMTDENKELPCTVMAQTDAWLANSANSPTTLAGLLDQKFITKYAVSTIAVSALSHGDNADSIAECRKFVSRHSGWSVSSSPIYIIGIIVPAIALVIFMIIKYRRKLAQRQADIAGNVINAAAGSNNQAGPAGAVPATAAAVHNNSFNPQQGPTLQQTAIPYGYPTNKPLAGNSSNNDDVAHVYAAAAPGVAAAAPSSLAASYPPAPTYASSSQVPVTGWPTSTSPQYPYPAIGTDNNAQQQQAVSGYSGNTVVATAGGPIERRQGVWSRMFSGPQRM